MEAESCETMTVEPVEWPFIKAQKEGGDPAVGGRAGPTTAADHDDDVHVQTPPGSNSQYEIVVSNVHAVNAADELKGHEGGLQLDVEGGPDPSHFETCLISSADLAALNTTPNHDHHGGGIKIETFKVDDGVHQYSLGDPSDALVGASSSSSAVVGSSTLPPTLIADPHDEQKLIRVYQTAMEDNDNKLITVYEIKPESMEPDPTLDGVAAPPRLVSGVAVGDPGDSEVAAAAAAAKDVLVEIVPQDADQHLLRTADGSTLSLATDPTSGQTHLLQTIPAMAARPTVKRVLSHAELQAQLGQSVPLPPEELAAVTNSAARTVNASSGGGGAGGANSLAELRCTLCGFVSYSRDEIASHCEESHELFLCQACNLVFKKRASLQSHTRAKHNNQSLASYHGNSPRTKLQQQQAAAPAAAAVSVAQPPQQVTNQQARILTGVSPHSTATVFSPNQQTGSPKTKLVKASKHKPATSSIVLSPFPVTSQLSSSASNKLGPSPVKVPKLNISLAPSGSPAKSGTLEFMPDIRDILSKNQAVLPTYATGQTTTTPAQMQQGKGRGRGGGVKPPAGKVMMRTSGGAGGRITIKKEPLSGEGKTTSLVLDSRLSDPQTRSQFNKEFAKKITATGVGGPELFGMPLERLPSIKGTFRLDIRERPADNGDITNSGPNVTTCVPSNGEPATNGREMLYNYDIVDTGIVTSSASSGSDGDVNSGCKVICGICSFSNARIENVLFHCEIDHKQYYCQNKRCQLGFSSWDSLMRHMKHTHRKEK